MSRDYNKIIRKNLKKIKVKTYNLQWKTNN